jgi:sugar phosphate isomerase/epimerase
MSMNDKEENNKLPRYLISHLTLLGCSTPELTYIAARAGYDAICPRLIPMGVEGECPFPLLDREMLRATRMALKVTGMDVQAIELARITDNCNVKSYEAAIEAGAELGARQLIASAWTTGGNDHNYLVDTYADLCDLAEPYGLSVALEFPSFSSIHNLQEAADIVRSACRPNGGILIDTLYMHMSRVNLNEIDTLPSAWFNHIHICDMLSDIPDSVSGMIQIARNSRLYPGEGCIDFGAIIERLPPVDYCVEIPNHSRLAELGWEEHARQCLQAAKRTLESARSKRISGTNPTKIDT